MHSAAAPPRKARERFLGAAPLDEQGRGGDASAATGAAPQVPALARYRACPIGGGDNFAVAPSAVFALLPFMEVHAVTHLTAARGFRAKVAAMKKTGRWLLDSPRRRSGAAPTT